MADLPARRQWSKRPVEELEPKQRAAFERRREVVAAAAEELIADRGPDVTMAEVAEAAGLGMSSVYRTFASKEELLGHLAERRVEHWAGVWRRARERDDPRTALVDAMWEFVELDRQTPGLADVVRGYVLSHRSLFVETTRAGERAVERARGAGLREGVGHDDIIRASELLAALPRTTDDRAWRRVLTIYIDGLFAREAGPLPAVGD